MTKLLRKLLGYDAMAVMLMVWVLSFGALAQGVPGTGPYNSNLGAVVQSKTLAGGVAGTYNSALISNYGNKGVKCVFNQTSESGTPSTTFAIQEYDQASATYQTILTSAAVTNDLESVLEVYPGIQTSSLPSGQTWASINLHLPYAFRVAVIVAGTNPGIIYTVGCNSLY